MKKYFMIALAALSLTMASCKSEEVKKAEAYMEQIDKAADAQDTEKMIQVAEECEAWFNGLTDDQKKKINDKSIEDLKKLFAKIAELKGGLQVIDESVNALNEMADSMDETAEAIDEAAEAMDEAVEVIDEAAE